jgi:hypothetical protein
MGVAWDLGGGMSFSTHGSTSGSDRTSGSVADFTSGFAAADSIGRSRKAATATTMANPSARSIAPAPTLRSGSPSNLWVRSGSRTAESRYLPRRRVAPAGRSPAATKTIRRTAPGSPLLSVGVPPVLPSSTSPLLPMILNPSPPAVLGDQPASLYSGTFRALRCTPHHILLGFPFCILERKSPRKSEGSHR